MKEVKRQARFKKLFDALNAAYEADDYVKVMKLYGKISKERFLSEKDRLKYSFAFFEQLKKDNAEALYKIGNCHYFGRGTERDCEKAVKWYEMAAYQGNENAKEALAKIQNN